MPVFVLVRIPCCYNHVHSQKINILIDQDESPLLEGFKDVDVALGDVGT